MTRYERQTKRWFRSLETDAIPANSVYSDEKFRRNEESCSDRNN